MKCDPKPITVETVLSRLEKKKYNLEHPLQRKAGQWTKQQQSLLIASLLQGYPINPIYVLIEEGSKVWEVKGRTAIIDGLQRITTIRDFCEDKFAIQRNFQTIDIDGDKVEIKGKKFSKLSAQYQDKIKDTVLNFMEITDYTEENLKELFYRQNSGTPLSKCQKATSKMDYETLQKLKILAGNSFWEKTALTAGIKKKDDEREILIEVMALIHDGDDVGSFNQKYLYDDFTERIQGTKDFDNYCKEIKEIFTAMNMYFPEKEKVMRKINIPMIIYGAYKAKETKGADYMTEYAEWLKDFFANYDDNEDYKQYCQNGSSQKANVLGRKKYFDDAIKKIYSKKK